MGQRKVRLEIRNVKFEKRNSKIVRSGSARGKPQWLRSFGPLSATGRQTACPQSDNNARQNPGMKASAT
jgi:hypothetical protein